MPGSPGLPYAERQITKNQDIPKRLLCTNRQHNGQTDNTSHNTQGIKDGQILHGHSLFSRPVLAVLPDPEVQADHLLRGCPLTLEHLAFPAQTGHMT